MEARQPALNAGEIAHARRVQTKADDDGGGDGDARQRRRDRLGELWQRPDDEHGQARQSQHHHQWDTSQPVASRQSVTAAAMVGAWNLELAQLGEENHDGQAVHKAQHHRGRHQPDEFAKFEDARAQLKHAHQHDGREQVFNAMFGHQRHHHDRQRARRARDHSRTAAEHRGDQAHDKSRIQANQRMHAGHKGEGHCFRHQRQRHRQTGQHFGFQPIGVGQRQVRVLLGQRKTFHKRVEGGFDHHDRSRLDKIVCAIERQTSCVL